MYLDKSVIYRNPKLFKCRGKIKNKKLSKIMTSTGSFNIKTFFQFHKRNIKKRLIH